MFLICIGMFHLGSQQDQVTEEAFFFVCHWQTTVFRDSYMVETLKLPKNYLRSKDSFKKRQPAGQPVKLTQDHKNTKQQMSPYQDWEEM